MQHAANGTSGDVLDWHAIDWKRVYRTVKNLRQRLFRASRDGDLRRVRSLQRLMIRSSRPRRKNGERYVGSSTNVSCTRCTPSVGSLFRKKRGNGHSVFPPSKIDASKPWCKMRSNRSGKHDLRASAMGFALVEDATMRLKKSFVSHGQTRPDHGC